ncbi:pyruvate formate-lyase 1-activating enzyme [Alkalitalea saponilacus]|uniref:Pyruvate formate-lyase-activating enzyme n=1 Tax=Alkalitalea saponilacus TaxID=889453 RepID=A0A1T5HTL9_9BACT|nr:pyruvate formate-lyase 1-activating enzyme [Alkalitalea saponilacus]SKC23982.1 pyruvate formate lyase activating enzyme [Alkalitalea saponilacus]
MLLQEVSLKPYKRVQTHAACTSRPRVAPAPKLRVHSVESLGTYDGPGIRLVIFLQGCNLKCLYCANPDTIEFGAGYEYELDNLVQMAQRQRPFFGKKGGVTVSGGEPLMQARDLVPFFQKLQNEGLHTCIDTNGTILNNNSKELLKHTDLVLLDIKHIDNQKHLKLTGKQNDRTLAFAEYLASENIPTWIRYVLVPGYSDDEEDLHKMGQFLANKGNIEKLEIQPYHKLGEHKYESLGWKYQLTDVPSNTEAQLLKAKTIFEQYLKEVVIN